MSIKLNVDCVKTDIPQHSSGKTLDVYDNIFSYEEVESFARFIKNSQFRIDGNDTYDMPLEMQTYSPYNHQDVWNMGFYNTEAYKCIHKRYNLDNMDCASIRINLTTPSERNRVHIDSRGLTLLYYANPVWEIDWGGHTLFMNDTMTDAEYTCLCKPSRLIVFDGTIPHMILTPSSLCPTYRTSFAIQYRHRQN